MTDNADFKKLVRERAKKTSESYTTARMNILAQRGGAAPRGMVEPEQRTLVLPALLSPPALDTYRASVDDLGVVEIRHTRTPKDVIDALYFVIPAEMSYGQEKALIQRLRERCSGDGVDLAVVRQLADGAHVAWSWNEEDAELRWEAGQRGVRVIREHSGRWAARTDNGHVEYGLTEGDARARLIHDLWDDENAWQNQVDDDTRDYIELQDDD